jgi:hypothetical protein
MSLETSLGGLWVLQALCGIETLPTALRCVPYVPSVHAELLAGGAAAPIRSVSDYTDLRAAGVVDADGTVDVTVTAWMRVLGRPDRSVILAARRPGYGTVTEHVMVVCRRGPYLAKIVRHEDRVLIDGVGMSGDAAGQIGLCATEIMAALGEYEPAGMGVVNLPIGYLDGTLATRWNAAAMIRLGATPTQADILAAAAIPEESALATVAVIDGDRIHPRVLTIADTDYGRLMLTARFGVGGQEWLSAQPGTTAGVRAELTTLLRAA